MNLDKAELWKQRLEIWEKWTNEQAELLILAGIITDKSEAVVRGIQWASSFDLEADDNLTFFTLGPRWQQACKVGIVAGEIIKERDSSPNRVSNDKVNSLVKTILESLPEFLFGDWIETCIWFNIPIPLTEICSKLTFPLSLTDLNFYDEFKPTGNAYILDGKFRLNFRVGGRQQQVLVYAYPSDEATLQEKDDFEKITVYEIAKTISNVMGIAVSVGKINYKASIGKDADYSYSPKDSDFSYQTLLVIGSQPEEPKKKKHRWSIFIS